MDNGSVVGTAPSRSYLGALALSEASNLPENFGYYGCGSSQLRDRDHDST